MMIPLLQRHELIIEYLLNRKDWTKASEVSKELNVSDRTIRDDIKLINEIILEHNLRIESFKGKGYRIGEKDAELFSKLISIEQKNVPILPEERMKFIIERLLVQKEGVDVFYLADEMFINEQTIEVDIKRIKDMLKDKRLGLTISEEKNIFFIEGKEIYRRYLLCNVVMDGTFESLLDLYNYSPYLKEVDLIKIKDILLKNIEDSNFVFSDLDLVSLIIHCAVSVQSMKQNFYLDSGENLDVKKDSKEVEIAKNIAEDFNREYEIVFNELEIANPEAKALCLCDMPISQEVSLAKVLGKEHKDLTFKYFGLNHFGWFSAIYDKDGKGLLPQLVKDILEGNKNTIDHVDIKTDPYWQETFKGIIKMTKYFPGFIPLTYLQYYFFPDEMVAKENPEYTRANFVMDHREKEVFEECEEVIKVGSVSDSSLLTGVHGNYIIDIAKSIAFDKKERFVVNVLNQGAISNSREDVVEVPCYVGSQGVEPIAVGKIPTFQKGLMEMEKSYEVLAVEACLEQDYDKALKALTLNFTIPSVGLAKKVLDDLIENNKEYFPDFKSRYF